MRGVALLAPVALAGGLAIWLLSAPEPTPAPAPTAAAAPLQYGWAAGTGYRYTLDFSSESALARFPQIGQAKVGQAKVGQAKVGQAKALTLDGRFRLIGHLELRSHGIIAGQTRLALRLADLSTAQIALLGQAVLTTPDAVATHLTTDTAWLSVDARGRVTQLAFAPGSSHLFRNVAQLLVSEGWFELGAGEGWATVVRTQHGEAETRYARSGDTVVRTRPRYRALQAAEGEWTATVDARATARIEPHGPLLAVDGHERVRAVDAHGSERLTGDTRIALRLIERFSFAVGAPPAGLVAYAPGESAERPGAIERHLDQRIAGLTGDALLNTLAEHGRYGGLPQKEAFLWRAAALLHREPALCDRLADLFESDAMGDPGRLLIIDLLTHSGAPGTQAALRRVLDSDVAEASPRYGLMYQRLGLVERADAETVAMAQARYRQPGPEGPHAAAYTLGAVARQAQSLAQAKAIGARLERDLLSARPEEGKRRRSLIYALGNAAYGAETVRGFVDDEHPDMRYAAAAALRHHRDAVSRSALVELTTDAEHRVAQRALRSLADADLSAQELDQLAALVAREQVNEVAYHAVVNLLTPYLDDPVARGILLRMLTQDLKDSRVKGRIRALLGGA